jgi:uncharacterized phage-associated protein
MERSRSQVDTTSGPPEAAGICDAREVVNFFLDLAKARGLVLTQIPLQKILYFAHAWFLARRGQPLVDEEFEAWEYGPVVRSVHEQFKRFGDAPILKKATRLNFANGNYEEVAYRFDLETADALERIFDFYSRYEPFALVAMTHEPGGPWEKVYQSGAKSARVGMRIPNDLICEHFAIYYKEKLWN